MNTGCKRNCQIRINGHEVEKIDQLFYLASIIDVQGGSDADMKRLIGKARQAFTSLKPVWSSKDQNNTLSFKSEAYHLSG